jgi:hypothetical protein
VDAAHLADRLPHLVQHLRFVLEGALQVGSRERVELAVSRRAHSRRAMRPHAQRRQLAKVVALRSRGV